ncbi:ComEA family DNA-binding protein [Marinomonas sp.]
MYSSEEQALQLSNISMNGCGYRIAEDRVIISIDKIKSNRSSDNLSGTLQVQLCALSQNSGQLQEYRMASTTIGELAGQCELTQCEYDLIFEEPPAGVWQFILQINEWSGQAYTLCDSAYFEVPYETDLTQTYPVTEVVTSTTESAVVETTTDDVATDDLVPLPEQVAQQAEFSAVEETQDSASPSTKPSVKKNSKAGCDDLSLINQAKKAQLRSLKVIHKKVLEKLIAERPFKSMKAVLNVKGMGPKILDRILQQLHQQKNGE